MRGLAFLAFAATAAARTFTVYNQCPFTIWPAIFTGAGNGPSQPNGWEQGAYQAVSFFVPNNWQAGRIWARRDCDFSNGATGPNTCADGGCNGGLVCTGTGVPPATLAEFTLGAKGADNYDVSLVDGYNLPMRITNSKGCSIADCPVDLGPNCPDPLKGPLWVPSRLQERVPCGHRRLCEQPQLLHGLIRLTGNMPGIRRGVLLLLQGKLPERVRVRVRRGQRHGPTFL